MVQALQGRAGAAAPKDCLGRRQTALQVLLRVGCNAEHRRQHGTRAAATADPCRHHTWPSGRHRGSRCSGSLPPPPAQPTQRFASRCGPSGACGVRQLRRGGAAAEKSEHAVRAGAWRKRSQHPQALARPSIRPGPAPTWHPAAARCAGTGGRPTTRCAQSKSRPSRTAHLPGCPASRCRLLQGPTCRPPLPEPGTAAAPLPLPLLVPATPAGCCRWCRRHVGWLSRWPPRRGRRCRCRGRRSTPARGGRRPATRARPPLLAALALPAPPPAAWRCRQPRAALAAL